MAAHLTDYRLPFDERVFYALNGLRWPWLDALFKVVTQREFGIACGALLALAAVWLLRKGAIRPLLQTAISVGVTDFVGHQLLKPFFGRQRPCFALPKLNVCQLVDVANSGSMPSLHAGTSFALATAIWLTWRPAGYIAYPLAALIALSRVGVGVHWPSDIVAGAAFGTLVSVLIHALVSRVLLARSPSSASF